MKLPVGYLYFMVLVSGIAIGLVMNNWMDSIALNGPRNKLEEFIVSDAFLPTAARYGIFIFILGVLFDILKSIFS